MSARCVIAFIVVNAFSRSAPADLGPPIIATVAMFQRPQPGGHHPVLAAGPLMFFVRLWPMFSVPVKVLGCNLQPLGT